MHTIVLDFETFYDRTFSLSKMTTEEYIRHEYFETIGVAVKVDDQPTQWFSGPDKQTKAFLDQFPWDDAVAVAHNAMFDMAILNWHFGIKPKGIADTLSMLRAIDGPDAGNSLAKAAERYGLGAKGDEVINALGKGRLDFTPEELARYGQYCINDVELTYELFKRIAPLFPKTEFKLIDLTIRMFSEPVLELDKDVLAKHLTEVKEKKDKLMAAIEADKTAIMSNPKLAILLSDLGVQPPMKVSPTTGKLTHAFSKTDEGFKALLDHENPKVQAIVAARLGVKSTLEESRTERFIGIAERGTLPVPLRYYAAHCLTGDAEVLTPTGWQPLVEWQGGDIAQWTPGGALRFAPAAANRFEVDEELVVSNARYHKAAYTKGHTVPGFSGRGVFKTLKAGDLLVKRLAIPLGGSLDGDNGLTELDARLAAMVQADGSIRDNNKDRSVRFGFKKPRKIARCKTLLEQAGVTYTSFVEASGATRIRVAQAHWGPLVRLVSGKDKSFSPELLTAPLTTKIAFMEEIAFWDGDVEPHGKGYTYTTTNEHNAQFVQTMAHVTGISAFVSEREREGWSKAYRVYVRRDDETRSEPKHYTTRRHTGAVYCPTTETGYFLMRQNGCITVTGNTGRWGGDDKVNLQNLPRKSPLKKAIRAPEGYVFIDCDSSQIEARTLAWLAGQDDLVEAFDRGEDVYKIMASRIYGVPEEEVTEQQRFVGKTTILGCFGPDTMVLTDHGWKRIVEVQATDTLWDGEEWVTHEGVVPQGEKETLTAWGLTATLDHEILTGHGWQEWSEVATNPSLFQSAIDRANWKSSDGNSTVSLQDVQLGGTPWSVAPADGKGGWTATTSKQHVQPGATAAQKARLPLPVRSTGGMKGSCLTSNIASAFSTVSLAVSGVATTPKLKPIPTTEVEAFLSTSRGGLTEAHSCDTSYRLTVGKTQNVTSTVSTILGGMSRAIFASLHAVRTLATRGRPALCRQKLMTYDIAYAGPRNRYTVATDAGPIIVHNCGYGMGAKKFQAQLKNFGVVLPLDECEYIINVYRRTYPKIVALWNQAGRALEALMTQRAAPLGREGVLLVDLLGIRLPNGMYIRYPNLRKHIDNATGREEIVYDTKKGRTTVPSRIYGGKVIENVCQALARIIIGEQMLMVARRLRVVMTVHDAVGSLAPVDQAGEARAFVEQCMRTRPKWAAGLPLNCESKMGASYGG